MRYLRLLVVALVVIAGPVLAGPLDDGMAAYGRQDYATAASLLLPLAVNGEAFPQYMLGVMFDEGKFLPKDPQRALSWYRKAAEQDVPVAMAQFKLGNMYADGRGVRKDDRQAVSWFRKAAEQGYAQAQLSLGLVYAKGEGLPKDDQQAYFWWLLASVGSNAYAVKNRDIVEKILTPQQRAAAQADARNWKPTKQ